MSRVLRVHKLDQLLVGFGLPGKSHGGRPGIGDGLFLHPQVSPGHVAVGQYEPQQGIDAAIPQMLVQQLPRQEVLQQLLPWLPVAHPLALGPQSFEPFDQGGEGQGIGRGVVRLGTVVPVEGIEDGRVRLLVFVEVIASIVRSSSSGSIVIILIITSAVIALLLVVLLVTVLVGLCLLLLCLPSLETADPPLLPSQQRVVPVGLVLDLVAVHVGFGICPLL